MKLMVLIIDVSIIFINKKLWQGKIWYLIEQINIILDNNLIKKVI